jgi:hypothetical protein
MYTHHLLLLNGSASSPHTLFNVTYLMDILKRLDFVMETQCIVYPIGTDFQLLS